MMSGLSDVSPSPKTNIVYLLRPQDTSKISDNPTSFLENITFRHFENLKVQLLEKTGAEHRFDPSNKFLKILGYGANIFLKT